MESNSRLSGTFQFPLGKPDDSGISLERGSVSAAVNRMLAHLDSKEEAVALASSKDEYPWFSRN